MTKTVFRLLAATAACLLSTGAQAAVTYNVSKADMVDVTFQTEMPITSAVTITDFAGQTCKVKAWNGPGIFNCSWLVLSTFVDSESQRLFGTVSFGTIVGDYRYQDGTSLDPEKFSTNGVYTFPNSAIKLTVSGVSAVTAPENGTSAVPEPATWALMLAGFGLTATALRRRSVRFAAVAA